MFGNRVFDRPQRSSTFRLREELREKEVPRASANELHRGNRIYRDKLVSVEGKERILEPEA